MQSYVHFFQACFTDNACSNTAVSGCLWNLLLQDFTKNNQPNVMLVQTGQYELPLYTNVPIYFRHILINIIWIGKYVTKIVTFKEITFYVMHICLYMHTPFNVGDAFLKTGAPTESVLYGAIIA